MLSSLRLRLFVIILVPVLLIAAGVGFWRVSEAQRTAVDLFDKSLLVTALAVSRDVASRDGDAISPETARLLAATAGGPVKYHVYAPDGVFVTGFATPPIPIEARVDQTEAFTYFDAVSRGNDVRVLRLQYVTQIAGFSGAFKVTVWQDKAARQEFVRAQARRAFQVMAVLIGATGLVIWFGVNLGLKPLLDLEEAISRRSAVDLSPIRRAVPIEAQGLVDRLNNLFGQVARSMEAQAAFISDAAHQLRNPIAGLRALGDSILTAPTLESAKARAGDLVAAAQDAGELAENLMTLERARAGLEQTYNDPVDLTALIAAVVAAAKPPRDVQITTETGDNPVRMLADATMLQEAVKNLIHNALVHGGAGLGHIRVTLATTPQDVTITVADDGIGVAREDFGKIRARFGQADAGEGSGLGLSIADAVAVSHRGRMVINDAQQGFSVSLILPVSL